MHGMTTRCGSSQQIAFINMGQNKYFVIEYLSILNMLINMRYINNNIRY